MPTFDLKAIEQQIRASLEAADIQRSDAVRAGAIDLPFAMAMKQFDEVRVQFLLAGLALENEGVQREVALSAAGQAIGSMWGNVLQYALGARERTILNERDALIDRGLLEWRDGIPKATELGMALVEMWLQTPVPRAIIIDPRTRQEVGSPDVWRYIDKPTDTTEMHS